MPSPLSLSVAVYQPQARAKVMETWENIRPAVVESMDNLHAAFRNLVAGNGSDHQLDENPGAPSPNFDVIITMKSIFSALKLKVVR